MPAREAFSPGAVPLDHPSGFGGLPQGEIARVALERVGFHPDGFQEFGFVDIAGQLAVLRESGHREIDVAVGLVRQPLLDEPLCDLYHLGDVVGRLREFVRGPDSQLTLVGQKAVGVELGYLGGSLAFLDSGGDYLVLAAFEHLLAHMPHVGDVLYVDDFQILGGEYPAYPVRHEIGAQVAYVRVPVHRRAAGVHPDYAVFGRRHFVQALAKRVIYLQHGPCPRGPRIAFG